MRTRTISIRGLTEGGILAALVALFTLAARYLPLIGVASTLISPLPLTILVVRHGLRTAIAAAAVAALLAGMIGGPLTGAAIILTFAPLGIAFGWVLRARFAAPAILLVCSGVAVTAVLANVLFTLVISGINPYTVMIEGMQQSQASTAQLYARLGIDVAASDQYRAMQQFLRLMPRLIPLLVVVGGVVVAYLNFETTRFLMRRFGYTVPALPPISTWRAPTVFLWLLPLGLGLTWIAYAAPVPFDLPPETLRMLPAEDVAAAAGAPSSRYPLIETAGLNLSYLVQFIYMLLGLVVAWVLLERYGAPRWLRWVAILVVSTSPFLGYVIFFLGIADGAFDLRGRWRTALARGAAS